MVFVGFAVIVLSIVLLFARGVRDKGRVRGGGVVIIGPFPIIFGTDKESVKIILVLSIILVVLLLILTIFASGVFQ